MDGFSQLQGVERSTKTQLDTGSQFLRVRQGGQTRVGDLSLDKGRSVQSVLGGEFNVDLVRLNRVPGGLGTNFNEGRHLVVVGSVEDSQVRRSGSGKSVVEGTVTNTERVLVDLSRGNVVTQFGTGGETVVSHNQVSGGNGALEQVKEQSRVNGRLLVEEVKLGGSSTVGDNRGVQFTLEAGGQQFRQFNLGAQDVGVVPRLGEGQASGLVDVLGFNRGGNRVVLGGLTLDGERNTIGGNGLDVDGSGRLVVEVLVQQVVSRLLEVRVSNGSHVVESNEEEKKGQSRAFVGSRHHCHVGQRIPGEGFVRYTGDLWKFALMDRHN